MVGLGRLMVLMVIGATSQPEKAVGEVSVRHLASWTRRATRVDISVHPSGVSGISLFDEKAVNRVQ